MSFLDRKSPLNLWKGRDAVIAAHCTTPVVVAEGIMDVVIGQKVCDVGCGRGRFAASLLPFASSVCGIEINDEMAAAAKIRGIDVVCGDYLVDDLPAADVYYLWLQSSAHRVVVLRKICAAVTDLTTVVLAANAAHRSECADMLKTLSIVPDIADDVRAFEFDETDEYRASCSGTIPTHALKRLKGTFFVCVFDFTVPTARLFAESLSPVEAGFYGP